MTTITDLRSAGGTDTIITIERTDPRADLDAYEGCIHDLDRALADAAAARMVLDAATLTLERLEAGHVLSIEGGNAETRKARLTLTLADDARHEQTVRVIDQERTRLLDAERRVTLAKERCRLIRAALAIIGEEQS